jgi:hypothetical protein
MMTYPIQLLPITFVVLLFTIGLVLFVAHHSNINTQTHVDFDLGIEVDERDTVIIFVDDCEVN